MTRDVEDGDKEYKPFWSRSRFAKDPIAPRRSRKPNECPGFPMIPGNAGRVESTASRHDEKLGVVRED